MPWSLPESLRSCEVRTLCSPRASNTSTTPPTSGSSIPTIVRSICILLWQNQPVSQIPLLRYLHIPHIQKFLHFPVHSRSCLPFGLFATLHAIACSLPPLPTINTFILSTPSVSSIITLTETFPSVTDTCHWRSDRSLRKDLPFCFFHYTSLKLLPVYLRAAPSTAF